MLRTIDIRKTMTSLVFLCFWLSSSVTGGQIFSEVKAISGSPSADGEGRLMRLRTCHDVFMVQCEPCEVIHIVNASYAATRLQHRNPIHGCSDLTFQQEFDCLLSAKAQYFEAITGSCDGIQTCQFAREGSFVSCGHSSKTWSCCMEIYYTCEPKNYQIQTLHFSANDFYGNVNNVSLQCQSSDLSIDSVVWVFNSSIEVNKGDVCYKVLPDTKDLKRRCEGRGCSDVYVHGDSGCGGNENVFNHGLYVCCICKDRKLHKSTLITPESALLGSSSFRQGLNSIEAGGITTQYSAATTDGNQIITSSQYKTAKRTSSIIPSHEEATTTKLSPMIESTPIIAASQTVESSTTTEYIETTESTTKSLTSESSSNATSSARVPHLRNKANMWVISGASLVVGVLLCVVVGYIVCSRRRRIREKNEIRRIGKLCRDQHFEDDGHRNQNIVSTPNQVCRRDERLQTEVNRYTYVRDFEEPDQDDNNEYCYVTDRELAMKQRWRGDEASRETDKKNDTVTTFNGSPNPGKLGTNIDHNKIFEGKKNLKPVRADGVNHQMKEKSEPVYPNVEPLCSAREPVYDLQKQEQTTMYSDINRSKQKLKPVSKTADLNRDNIELEYSLVKQPQSPPYTEVSVSKPKPKPVSKNVATVRNDQEPVYLLQKHTDGVNHKTQEKSKPVYPNFEAPRSAREPVYDLQKHEPTIMYSEINRPKPKPKPVSKNADPSRNNIEMAYSLPKESPSPPDTEVSVLKQKPKPPPKTVAPMKNDQEPVYLLLKGDEL